MRFIGFAGIAVFLFFAFLLSSHRRRIHWPTIAWGVVLQGILGIVVLKGDWVARLLSFIPFPRGAGWGVVAAFALSWALSRLLGIKSQMLHRACLAVGCVGMLRGNLVGEALDRLRLGVDGLMQHANAGSSFVFGKLSGAGDGVFAFSVLPVIIFVASLFSVFYHLGWMQWVVGAASGVMGRFLRVSGAESVSVAASILMGQTEAPLTIRPFLSGLTRSELMVIMTAGMAHVSGSILVAYVQMAHVDIVHLLTAVLMTAPGAIVMAKMIEPETQTPATGSRVEAQIERQSTNLLDAAARGAIEGGQLAFHVAVVLVAFVGLVALVNGMLGVVNPGLSLEAILAVLFKPLALLMGVPSADAATVGSLLGKRMVLNEFVAFNELGRIPAEGLSETARRISTFALCGFANFGSIAIQIGGIGALIPDRRADLAQLGVRAMLAGTLANFVSACIAGILMG
jgi:CNT family concentrative nucleoside transporter